MKIKLILFLIMSAGIMVQENALWADSVAGTYRCWMFNVAGAGKRCTSPALVLQENGHYTMGSEKGTYKIIQNGQVILSESKIRGPGRFQEQGNQIVFEYTYRNWPQVVTYLKQDTGRSTSSVKSADAPRVNVDVTILFPESANVGWINGAAIIEEGENTGPETLANNDGKKTVTAYFRNMPAGKKYKIYVTTGFEKRFVGTIDLRNVKEDVKFTLRAPR